MAGIDVKMGVSGIAQFKSAMQQGAQSVKTLDAALKKNEAQYKATGDAETYMQQKTQLLQKQIAAQQEVCSQAEKALEAMTKQGVDPASRAYQQMQQNLLNAQTALLGMQTDLNGVSTGAKGATDSARQMNTELKNIGKQVDYQAVINGMSKITEGMEAAGKAVAKFAGDLWNTMRDAASWADDQMTLAQMYGIDVEELQRMQETAEHIQTPVEAIIKARQKLSMGLSGGFTAEQTEVLSLLGLTETGKYGTRTKSYENAVDMMWDVGEALEAMGDSYERDAYAQTIFGRSWMELKPLFDAGREAYEEYKATVDVVSEENIEKGAELSDSIKEMEHEFDVLKRTVLFELAPAFTELSKSLTSILQEVNKYLQSDEGKEKLEAIGDAVTELFQNLTNVDTSAIVEKVSGALDTIKGIFDWIVTNKEAITTAIKAIGLAFAGMKVAEVVTTLVSAASGLKGLLGGAAGGAASGAAGGAAANASSGAAAGGGAGLLSKVGGGLATAFKFVGGKVVPIVGGAALGLSIGNAVEGRGFTVIASTGSEDLFDAYGNTTQEGYLSGITARTYEEALALGQPTTWNEVIEYKQAQREAEYAAKSEEFAAIREAKENARRLAAEEFWDTYKSFSEGDTGMEAADEAFIKLSELYEGKEEELEALLQKIVDLYDNLEGKTLEDLPDSWFKDGENPELPVDPVLSDDAQGSIQQQLDGVTVHVQVIPDLVGTGVFADDGEEDVGFANGLPWVPHDGFYKLHGGERVMTAAQNRSYTSNSNIYFDHVNVGGGVDADGLAARIAERTRRAMSGFGG